MKPYVYRKKRAKNLPAVIKNCVNCGKPFRCPGYKVAGPNERKHCGAACMHAHKRFEPRHADRMFWPKVDRSGGPDACWPYHRTDPRGYGRFLKAGPYAFAHRTAWLLTKGEISGELEICHTCDNRACCNPSHMYLGTHDQNMADQKARGRTTAGERNYWAKLTVVQVRAIRERFGGTRGEITQLAREYGVEETTMRQVVRGLTWKSV